MFQSADGSLWSRWWFLRLLAAGVLAAGAALYRMRVEQLLELERVRTRIATDLHDDIGSNLSQIAILSEIALQKDGDSANHGALARIAEVSRETVHSMSDIVWAADPEHDCLSDLVNRMRRFARIPTLWGVKDTAPYFHDNSAKTLEDVALHYSRFFQLIPGPITLTAQDQADIVAYLKLLN